VKTTNCQNRSRLRNSRRLRCGCACETSYTGQTTKWDGPARTFMLMWRLFTYSRAYIVRSSLYIYGKHKTVMEHCTSQCCYITSMWFSLLWKGQTETDNVRGYILSTMGMGYRFIINVVLLIILFSMYGIITNKNKIHTPWPSVRKRTTPTFAIEWCCVVSAADPSRLLISVF
jgi:hypothetical protein